MSARHFVAQVAARDPVSMDEFGLRAPFGWQVAGLNLGRSELALSWPDISLEGETLQLRIAVLDTREPLTRVEARAANSSHIAGEFEIRWAAHFQIYEVSIDAEIAREGVVLRVIEGEKPLWILTGGNAKTPLPAALAPHLLPPDSTDKRAEFLARLGSLASVQCFGWMEGCVLDGLSDLSATHPNLQPALHAHLNAYFSPDGGPFYESYAHWPDGTRAFGAPADERIYGIEATLPFAALCREFPDHPALQIALDFWDGSADLQGVIQDGDHTSSEGAYTVGYPLAVLAKSRRDEALARRALLQITARHERLFDGENFYRTRQPNGAGGFEFGNRNWARGVAWQLLGAARTLGELEGWIDVFAARAQFVELAQWALQFQLPDGLWSVFLDETELLPDTSGSAAIATAFALGARRGWLEPEFLEAAQLTNRALDAYLTPDGFLRGASASNKGGEELQRAPYRPIYQMGMGLMAQLIAALAE